MADVLLQDNVVRALAAILEEMPGIGKTKQAAQQQGGYAYRGIEDITRVLQPLLAKHHVIITPRYVECGPVREIMINNKPWTDERVLVTYRIYGPAGPEDYIDVMAPGLGRDNSDKGTNKALTQAFKYALIQTFCISDPGDDADGSTHVADSAGSPSAEQAARAELINRVQALDINVAEAFTKWKADQGFPWPWPADAIEAMHQELDRIETLADDAESEVEPPDRCMGCGEKFTKTGQSVRAASDPRYHEHCVPF